MFWTKTKGTAGNILSEDDFIVEEIPSRKYFVKFRRGASGVQSINGPFTLGLLTKRGMTTRDALRFVQKELSIKIDDIGYAGLKDKFALTSQYITIKGEAQELTGKDVQLKIIGHTDKMMQVGDLEGNRFTIRLHGCKDLENIINLERELEKGIPNYFGPQRFGMHRDNHIIGKMILKDQAEALKIINERNNQKFDSLLRLEKRAVKFYIHAYQSYLFNKILSTYRKQTSQKLPVIGYDTQPDGKIRKVLQEEKIETSDFSIRNLSLKCRGSLRDAFVEPKDFRHEIDGNTLTIFFTLPKGSYATVLIREVTKVNNQDPLPGVPGAP